ncbi:MAG: CopG family antitoxin [Oscillatoria sp. PMC 1068.18]|nr:CopG family antitoxin [Oscillatoria sp. PMC 1068.18]NET90537.1 CopG family transcriptional regulator [Kamptonema sp. SIO1D9]
MKASELDQRFDDGEDVLEYFDLDTLKRPGLETKRVNVDFPQWMVEKLDMEAKRLGVPRQAVIKVWIAERLSAF